MLLALCLLIVLSYARGGIGIVHLVLWETVHQTTVAVIGNVSRGPAQLAVAKAGSQQSALRNNQPGGALPPLESARQPLEVVRPPLEGESLLLLPGLPGVCFVVLLPLPLSVLPLLIW